MERNERRFIFSLALVVGALGGCATDRAFTHTVAGKQLGIEVLSLRRTAAGHLLDLRYRVTDMEKAAPLRDRKIRFYLVDQATGAQLAVPSGGKVGLLRQTPTASQPAQIYFALFANPNQFVQAGSKMTLMAGAHKLENLTVE